MNIGKQILELRKTKSITQEELAAELGVTAAAVSKWENGYTLPDILMLCALADYFEVTTDELLGRNQNTTYAVIATDSPELGKKIQELANANGFMIRRICNTIKDAFEVVSSTPSITHLFACFSEPLSEPEKQDRPDSLCFIEVQATEPWQVLDGFKLYFNNKVAYDSLALKQPIKA